MEVVHTQVVFTAHFTSGYYASLSRLQGKLENQSCSFAQEGSLEAAIQATVKPTVIKPNNEELSQLLEKEVSKNVEDLKEVLQDALFDGIEWVIVSLSKWRFWQSTATSSMGR